MSLNVINMVLKVSALILASSVPFLFSLEGDFVFDDSEAVIKNQDVFGDSWLNAFRNDFWGTNITSNLSHKSYRPLTILSFRLNYLWNNKLFSALQFKATNLVFHILCCLLLQQTFNIFLESVLLKCSSKKWWQDISFLATMLFCTHPVHVEAICGVVGRGDLLSAVTFFLAFICYSRANDTSVFAYLYLLATIILASLAMLFKENGITVLGLCIVYEFISLKTKRKKTTSFVHTNKESMLRFIFIMMSVILLLYGRWIVMGRTKPEFKAIDNPAAYANSYFTKVTTYNYIYFLNLLLFIWPQWLCYDWSMGCVPLIDSVLDYRLLLVLLLYIYGISIILALINRKNNVRTKRLILLAISLMVLPFLPAANIFYPVGFVIAERILYIPSAGYCLLLAIGLNKIICIARGRQYKIIITSFCLLILLNGLRSWQRSYEWQNEYKLFVSGQSVCPLNAKIHYNIAKVADAKQQTKRAIEEYREAIRLYPDYYQAMNNLANLLKNEKMYAEAESYLRNATILKRDFPAAWMNLGIVLANVGQYKESLEAYQNALHYRKNYPDCLYNLGNLYLELKKTEEAVDSWSKAIKLNSKHALAWTNLLALLDNTDQLDKALQIIPAALAEMSECPAVNFAIANIYGKLNKYYEAEEHFKKAIRLFDSQVQAIHFANLGVLYHRWKKYNLAMEMYNNALKVDPHFKSALRNLKSLQKI